MEGSLQRSDRRDIYAPILARVISPAMQAQALPVVVDRGWSSRLLPMSRIGDLQELWDEGAETLREIEVQIDGLQMRTFREVGKLQRR